VASSLDVIDGLEGTLPFRKPDLRFDGLLVARSVGLQALYRDYAAYERRQWPRRLPGRRITRLVHRVRLHDAYRAGARSLRAADVVRVLNDDEVARLAADPALARKAVAIPEGLPTWHLDALRRSSWPAENRLSAKEVCFIGSWCLRKGAADWARIVSRVRAAMPEVRFTFLGTGVPRSVVVRDLETGDSKIRVIPAFRPDELPELLRRATVGALPTYVEGCGLGVLEQMAAGIPSVAYNVPGPRATLRGALQQLMVDPGDVDGFAERLLHVLKMSPVRYASLTTHCRTIADQHDLAVLTSHLAHTYERALGQLHRDPVDALAGGAY
jgi:glycosyltransferase involved in cell wall biosynthesis